MNDPLPVVAAVEELEQRTTGRLPCTQARRRGSDMTSCVLSWYKPGRSGHASIRVGDRKIGHHRRVLEAKLGRPLLPGMIACHIPMTGGHPGNCIRPDHLYEGTRQGNVLDSVADGTHACATKEFCDSEHPFTDENTYIHKATGKRMCRECRMLAMRRRRAGETGPRNSDKTHCKNGHEYTEENTYIVPSTGYRQCRTCQRMRNRGEDPSQ